MNSRKDATAKITSFLGSAERFLLLTGTHQLQKHSLVLQIVLSIYPAPATILFRSNHTSNIQDQLSSVLSVPRSPKSGTPYNVTAGRTLYVDTMNRASWRSTPQHVDVAIVYPLDALEPVEDECVQDLVSRGAKRVFLVSWTDNKNFDWVDQLKPVRVVYDAEEEDPEYHQRMIKVISETYHERSPGKLPSYAQSTPYNLLVRILCRGHCGTTRWARLDEPFPGTTALKGAKMGEYRATCLVCGYTASDNYNWFR